MNILVGFILMLHNLFIEELFIRLLGCFRRIGELFTPDAKIQKVALVGQ
jgi:hypothetical protein